MVTRFMTNGDPVHDYALKGGGNGVGDLRLLEVWWGVCVGGKQQW